MNTVIGCCASASSNAHSRAPADKSPIVVIDREHVMSQLERRLSVRIARR
jgi:hypothetical protein